MLKIMLVLYNRLIPSTWCCCNYVGMVLISCQHRQTSIDKAIQQIILNNLDGGILLFIAQLCTIAG